MRRRLTRVGAGLAIALAIVTVRVLWSSRVQWAEAEARLALGETPAAVDHFGRAARLYAPGNPWSRRALDRLEDLASGAEAAGDREAALSAWREVRSSVLATRAIYAPNADRLPRANERIAALMAATESPALDPGADEAARRRWHAERLAHSDEPSVFWSLVALAGLGGWIGAAVGFLLRGVDERDRLRGRLALLWALGIAGGMALFVLGLARA